MSNLFGVPVDAAYHLVSALAAVFAPLPGGLAAAAAIIVFTVAVRLLVLPLSYYAVRGEKARARLAPRVQELQRKHAHQPQRLQRELSALYQAEGSSMFAGCLPALLQIPFFSVVYRLFLSRTVGGRSNALLSHSLLSAPLGSHWLGGPGPFSAQGAVFVILFLLLGVVAVFSLRAAQATAQSGSPVQSGGAAQPGGAVQSGGAAQPGGAVQSGGAAQPGGAVQPGGAARSEKLVATLGRFMPFGTVLMAAVVPLAAGLYLLTTTAWTVTERTVLRCRLRLRP
jgi:YidC/Oxa1 family membrane protein insertase